MAGFVSSDPSRSAQKQRLGPEDKADFGKKKRKCLADQVSLSIFICRGGGFGAHRPRLGDLIHTLATSFFLHFFPFGILRRSQCAKRLLLTRIHVISYPWSSLHSAPADPPQLSRLKGGRGSLLLLFFFFFFLLYMFVPILFQNTFAGSRAAPRPPAGRPNGNSLHVSL